MIPKNFISKTKPKGYYPTRLIFSNPNSAWKYISKLKRESTLKRTKKLEMNLSKRKKKLIKFSKSNKYLLTRNGKKYLLWEKTKKNHSI